MENYWLPDFEMRSGEKMDLLLSVSDFLAKPLTGQYRLRYAYTCTLCSNFDCNTCKT